MNMSNKTYDTLKWIAQYLLPAAGTLYFALAGIWGLPYGEQVVGTITAVDTFWGFFWESVRLSTTRQRVSDEKFPVGCAGDFGLYSGFDICAGHSVLLRRAGVFVLCHSCVVRYRRDCKLYFGKEG